MCIRDRRTPNILAENSYLLASAANFYVNGELLGKNPALLDDLKMEDSWNFGANVNRKFEVFGRTLNINLDYYHTKFNDQVVVDNETTYNKVNFYNLDGDSYSNCYQVEVKYELIPRLEATLAYRYNDAVSYTHLDVSRIFHAELGTTDGNLPIFKWLSQYFQYCPAELWEFV